MQKKHIANVIIGSMAAYTLLYLACAFFVLARYRGGLLAELVDIAPVAFCTIGGVALMITLSEWLGAAVPKPNKFFYIMMGLMGLTWLLSSQALLEKASPARILKFVDYSLVLVFWCLALRKMRQVHGTAAS